MHLRLPAFFLSLLLLGTACSKKTTTPLTNDPYPRSSSPGLWVAFYNVENLFDTEDEPEKIDEDFTPDGRYQWTRTKYQTKLENLARAIAAMGEAGPEIIGLAEVENRQVVEDLVAQSGLQVHNYRIVHEETPDMRGIDNALLYDPSVFEYETHLAYEMKFPAEPDYTSRKVLWVKGKVEGEGLHILVNHWPSRYGGQEESEPRRLAVAEQVRSILDRILAEDPKANILLLGDFNDDPFNKSLAEVIGARKDIPAGEAEFYNPMYAMHQPDSVGTLTYRGKWNMFDQVLISQGLLDKKGKLRYEAGSASIFRPEFMQVGGDGPAKDMPKRAIYRGEFQPNGFADHFPVYIRLSHK